MERRAVAGTGAASFVWRARPCAMASFVIALTLVAASGLVSLAPSTGPAQALLAGDGGRTAYRSAYPGYEGNGYTGSRHYELRRQATSLPRLQPEEAGM